MLFNSLEFAVFFPIVALIYFILNHRFRWFFLFVASCVFYMAFVPKFILILFFLILTDYFAGLLIEKATGHARKGWLILSLVANLGTLCFFKYFNFFNANLAILAEWMHWNYSVQSLSIVLPIGLSFHVFQSMSYTIEVYYGRYPAERHLGIYALYVLFFPQMVAGPIERPQHLLPQFRKEQVFDRARFVEGMQLMLAGFFKKMAIADRLAIVVNPAYSHPEKYSGFALLMATYFFAIQIYCDFSGYTDIARGAAKILGLSLIENFNRPYFARSLSEFWKRWHISLSTWFRDYLYIPLGGNRRGLFVTSINLMVVFFLSGLWHGANWTYIVWGGIHGGLLVLSIWTAEFRKSAAAVFGLSRESRFKDLLSVFFTFQWVSLAWVFFRAESVSSAFSILGKIAGIFSGSEGESHQVGLLQGEIVFSALLVLALLVVQILQSEATLWQKLSHRPKWQRWSAYYLFVLALFALSFLGMPSKPQQFIYFQF